MNRPKHKIRIVTSAALFDGHDAAINIMRRILQSTGAEVIHLGHNRSVDEVVNCAIQEDVQGIALTSYQGGHLEYFKYMYDLLQEKGASHIKIFGGGGGVILPREIEELKAHGIAQIYSPDDGRRMGLQGMIDDMLKQCDFQTITQLNNDTRSIRNKNTKAIASAITMVENHPHESESFLKEIKKSDFPDVDGYTFDDIIKELKKPGRDPRKKAKVIEFDSRIRTIDDLQVGMILPGIVTNVTAFGAFVNIGIKENGLIHKSNLSDQYVNDPSEFVSLHQHVQVEVMEVDVHRKRIGLKKL
jgi:methylmalonyl-CoA mutase cobalamin-binding domain/chain